MVTDYHCPTCGHALVADEEWVDCAECGRPIGACPDCGWVGRLFSSDDPHDCEACGAPRDPEASRLAMKRLNRSIARMDDAIRQMHARSGPVYERATAGSRMIAAAYRAAGRPRRVYMVTESDGAGGWKHTPYFKRRGERFPAEPATEADAVTWDTWVRQRTQLRQGLNERGSDES